MGREHSQRDRFRAYIGFHEGLAHRIEAGSDFFVMPSRFEPCGLNQMYSLRYGTLPVVRATGGLADTVLQYDETTGDGTGFRFDDLDPDSLADAIGWALFFIWVGTGFQLDVGWGVGLVGIGAIVLGGQVARRYSHLKLEAGWVVCGSLFLLGGLWELFGVTLPLFPVLFIVAGLALLISTLSRKPTG